MARLIKWKQKCFGCGTWFFTCHASKTYCDRCKANRSTGAVFKMQLNKSLDAENEI